MRWTVEILAINKIYVNYNRNWFTSKQFYKLFKSESDSAMDLRLKLAFLAKQGEIIRETGEDVEYSETHNFPKISLNEKWKLSGVSLQKLKDTADYPIDLTDDEIVDVVKFNLLTN